MTVGGTHAGGQGESMHVTRLLERGCAATIRAWMAMGYGIKVANHSSPGRQGNRESWKRVDYDELTVCFIILYLI